MKVPRLSAADSVPFGLCTVCSIAGYPQYTQPTTGAARDLGVRDTGRTVQQVTGTRMVPVNQTVMQAQMVQQPRTYMETHSRSVQVPRVVMEDVAVETKHPKIEMEQKTIQVGAQNTFPPF